MKITILHGSNDLYGASRVLLNEIDCLNELGHDVTVLLPSEGPLTVLAEAHGAEVNIFRALLVLRRSRLRDLLRLPRLPPAVLGSDVVVLWTLAMAAYAPVLRLIRKPFYVSVHELLDNRLGYWLLKLLMSSGGFPLTACSVATESWLVGAGVAKGRISVTYPVFPEMASRRAANDRSNDHKEGDKFTIAVVGRINGHKGHQEVARAFQIASRGSSDWQLLLAGAPFLGQEVSLLELEAICADDPRITLTGQLESIQDIPGEVDLIACFPTKPEPFGLVPIEAWELGIMTAGFDDGGASEVLQIVGGMAVKRTLDPISDIVSALRKYKHNSGNRTLHPYNMVEPFFRLSTRTEHVNSVLKTLGSR